MNRSVRSAVLFGPRHGRAAPMGTVFPRPMRRRGTPRHHGVRAARKVPESLHAPNERETAVKSAGNPRLPTGWSGARVAEVIAHYETQSEEDAVAEDEAALSDPGQTVMVIPTRLVPAVRELLASSSTYAYASALRAAVDKYRFPTVTYASRRNRKSVMPTWPGWRYIGRQLRTGPEGRGVWPCQCSVRPSPGRRAHRVREERHRERDQRLHLSDGTQ